MANSLRLAITKGAGKTAVCRAMKKMRDGAGRGAKAKRWPTHFFVARNTAVRGAEVHSLPLNFPLKKAGYGLQAHGNFGTELFYLLLWIGERIF